MLSMIRKKIARNVRDYGLGRSIQKLVAKALSPLFEVRAYYIYVIDLRRIASGPAPAPSGIGIRFIEPDETALIAQIEDMEEWLHGRVSDKLRRGQKCLTALRGNDVAGFNLISFDTLSVPAVHLTKSLRPAECASEQITVHPKYRGLGLGGDLRNAFFQAMKEAGYRRIYGGTDVTNTANQALSRRVGLKIFAKARYRRICGLQRLVISRPKP
jgi:ribosomal protein S18 acetylase RimI-like enzyme